ncbi:diaminopimelate epimerase [Chromatiales bacterium (ex Bugula neritina AB1)]|nr:diaminopimelate epimerase [Chromatiales bacterium (ex Bugula neritina AB1)]
MKFTKYHALGNDYIVVDPKDLGRKITAPDIKALCSRHYGIGADGILYGPSKSERCDFSLRIFNPDASEAEKSGNGLRIFSRFLWDCGLVDNNRFSIETCGGDVYSTIHDSGKLVSVEMGIVRFTHEPDGCPDICRESISLDEISFDFYRASVGNPHCVIPVEDLSPVLAKKYGLSIERDSRFNNRTNIQFVKVIDNKNIQIEIWERGAGYTLASGSSSTASAAVCHALGFCGPQVSVHMPGGVIEIGIENNFYTTMTGSVCKIGEGILADETLQSF